MVNRKGVVLSVRPDGAWSRWRGETGGPGFLSILRRGCGCAWVDAVEADDSPPLFPGITIWVDDEGLLVGKPFNPYMSLIHSQPLAGTATLTAGSDDDGRTLAFDEDEADAIATHLSLRKEAEVPFPEEDIYPL